jgi:DNA-binding transcriptional LysR family regulator
VCAHQLPRRGRPSSLGPACRPATARIAPLGVGTLNPSRTQVDKSRRICEAVAAGEVEVAIVGGSVPDELRDRLTAVPYARDEVMLVVPRNHPAAHAGSISTDDLYGLTFVSLNHGSTVQAVQESTLLRHGIVWSDLRIDMVRRKTGAVCMLGGAAGECCCSHLKKVKK